MQERAENTRQAVLVGAAVSFEKYGYGTASLSTILAHAGVTKGAMYFHFSSKEDLANAVIDAQHQLAMDGLRAVLDHVPNALDAMILASQELARQLVVDPVARGGMRLTLEIGSIQPPVKRPYIDWIESIGKLAARAAAEGDIIDGVDPEMLATFVVGAFHRRADAVRGPQRSHRPVPATERDVADPVAGGGDRRGARAGSGRVS